MKLQIDLAHKIIDLVQKKAGIAMADDKVYLLESRLEPFAKELGCSDFDQMFRQLSFDSTGSLVMRLIDLLTINETHFFRDNTPFELLKFKLIPDFIDHVKIKRPMRIWSAACSTGQEAISIAIAAAELDLPNFECFLSILGTDISNEAVKKASRARYSDFEVARGLTPARLNKHFLAFYKEYQLKDELRSLISYRRYNLMDTFSPLGKFDVIFCRYVAIYFDLTTRLQLFEKLSQALHDGGKLIIGKGEILPSEIKYFKKAQHLGNTYFEL